MGYNLIKVEVNFGKNAFNDFANATKNQKPEVTKRQHKAFYNQIKMEFTPDYETVPEVILFEGPVVKYVPEVKVTLKRENYTPDYSERNYKQAVDHAKKDVLAIINSVIKTGDWNV